SGIREHADPGAAPLRRLRRGGGDRRAGVLDRLQLVGGAVPRRDLVPDLHEPLRDGGAHLAYAGDPDLHANSSAVVSASGPIPKFVSARGTLRYEFRNLRTTGNLRASCPF